MAGSRRPRLRPRRLYVDTWDPHEPWDAPDYYTALSLPEYDGRKLYPAYGRWKDAGLSEGGVSLAHATYCGEVTLLDRWVGHLLHGSSPLYQELTRVPLIVRAPGIPPGRRRR